MTTYIYAITDGVHIKIGISKHPKLRRNQLSVGNSKVLYLLGFFEGDLDLESYIHTHYKRTEANNEWMVASDELLDYLNSMFEDRYIMSMDGKLRSLTKMKK